MYKTILIVLLALSLTSCQHMMDEKTDDVCSEKFSNIELYYGDFSEIESQSQIPGWMAHRVKYKETEKTQSPRESLERGYCDCDGYALLYMNIMYVVFDEKSSLCLVNSSKEIIDGGAINHALIRWHGRLIEPQNGGEYFGSVGYEYSFDHVFDY